MPPHSYTAASYPIAPWLSRADLGLSPLAHAADARTYPPGWTLVPKWLKPYILASFELAEAGESSAWPEAWPVLVFALTRGTKTSAPQTCFLAPAQLVETLALVGTRALPVVMEAVSAMGLEMFLAVYEMTPGALPAKLEALRSALLGAAGMSHIPGLNPDR